MNVKEIKELVALMNENNLVELEVEREGTKIRIRKSSPGRFVGVDEGQEGREIVQTVKPIQEERAATKETKAEENLVAINAPMVGTFYRTASPDAKPYVEIGQIIDVGEVVCIIEAMKLMNEIKSEVKGKVAEVLLENASPVEYGQPLFMVEPL